MTSSADVLGTALSELPEAHYLRNTKLIEIGAEYKSIGFMAFAKVTASFGIAKKTYNELGTVWTNGTEWRATIDPEAWDEKRIDIIGTNGNDALHYGNK